MHLIKEYLLLLLRSPGLLVYVLLLASEHPSSAAGVKDTSEKDSTHPDHSLSLFCNATGPCEPCVEGQKKVIHYRTSEHTVEETGCASTPYRQGLHCVLWGQRDSHKHDVKLEVPVEYKDRARGSLVVLQRGCERPAASMATFLLLAIALLCLSVPVIIWRKRIVRSAF
eukprot:jgi/Botrbrau1/2064/Bobra.0047s0029.1